LERLTKDQLLELQKEYSVTSTTNEQTADDVPVYVCSVTVPAAWSKEVHTYLKKQKGGGTTSVTKKGGLITARNLGLKCDEEFKAKANAFIEKYK
jgi:hypothetical protein